MTEIAGPSQESDKWKKKKEYQDTLYLQIKEITGYKSDSSWWMNEWWIIDNFTAINGVSSCEKSQNLIFTVWYKYMYKQELAFNNIKP